MQTKLYERDRDSGKDIPYRKMAQECLKLAIFTTTKLHKSLTVIVCREIFLTKLTSELQILMKLFFPICFRKISLSAKEFRENAKDES